MWPSSGMVRTALMTPSHAKGTRAETSVVSWLRDHGRPHVERRALQGTRDRGDIAGIPGVVIEVKAGARLEIPRWLGETESERGNDRADFGLLVVKPKGVGDLRVGDWWVIQRLSQAHDLLVKAGY